MRYILLLFLSVTCLFSSAQPPAGTDTSKVFIIGNCWGAKRIVPADTTIKKQLSPCKTGEQKQPATIRIRCGMTIPQTEPLLIVDGIPVNLSNLSVLNPNDIESITILKDAAALAIYGKDAAGGVILLTTKLPGTREFIVKDFTDGSPIPGATLTFTSAKDKTDTLMFVADEKGKVVTDRLKKGVEYSVVVTSVGYKNYSSSVKPSGKFIDLLLERNFRVNEDVIVTAYGKTRCCRCGCGGWHKTSVCTIPGVENSEATNKLPARELIIRANTIYPNPVQRSQSLTAELESTSVQKIQISIMSINGQTVVSYPYQLSKGANRISVNTSGNWSAGTYVLMVSSATQQIICRQKIIIQ